MCVINIWGYVVIALIVITILAIGIIKEFNK